MFIASWLLMTAVLTHLYCRVCVLCQMVHHYWNKYNHFMIIYVILSILCIALVPVCCFCLEMLVLNASRHLHAKMLTSIIAAPIQYVLFSAEYFI